LSETDELARAIRSESAAALRHWWGVGEKLVWRWRKAFGIGRADTEGSARLIRAASQQGAAVLRGTTLPPEQVERRRRTAADLNLEQHLRPGYNGGPRWSAEDLALLGTMPDEEVAAQIGRTTGAVRCKRTQRRIPTACDRRRAAPFTDTSEGVLG
jgi:hypothetical protein